MKHKQFWGKDMGEALRAVRSALGADAMISETKNLSKDLGGGVEITALANGELPDSTEVAERPTIAKAQRSPMDELREELALLKSMLGWLAPNMSQQNKMIESLVTHGVTPENISKLLHAVANAPAGDRQESWRHALATSLPPVTELRASGERLVLVGPSGMGKTSALIKLTLAQTQQRACHVGWVSMDERRLNFSDMLMAYAGILNIRFESASNRGELKIALDRLADCDLVLIDTPGTNPRNRDEIAKLTKSLHGLADLRCVMVLSAVTNCADLIDWVDSYRTLPLHSLLFTKLDECRYLGPILNTALSAAVPLSFITFGQSFTDDLARATPDVLASLLFTGVVHD